MAQLELLLADIIYLAGEFCCQHFKIKMQRFLHVYNQQ
jgi:hypothetical protein